MKVVLVTGASRGIGRGITLALSAAGYRVAVHYNGNREAAIETSAGCKKARGRSTLAGPDKDPEADIFQADISVSEERERLVDEVDSRYGRLDGLVNNAGIGSLRRDDLLVAGEDSFERVIRVNLQGPYFLTQLVARRWVELHDGETRRVVFVTSVSSQMPSTNRGDYCISKAGLSMAVQLFAKRLAAENVLVYEIRPGIIATDMTAGVRDKYDALIADGLVPQGRWGTPSDIGSVARTIMDGDLDFCAGTVIHADGGLSIHDL